MGERNLSLRKQSGMAAGEDKTEAIVLDLFISSLFISAGSVVDARFHAGKISLCRVEARAATDHVDGLEASTAIAVITMLLAWVLLYLSSHANGAGSLSL